MGGHGIMSGRWAAWVGVAIVVACAGREASAGKPIVCGTGASMSTNAKAAGIEAATQARQALGSTKAKVVLVHHSGALFKGRDQVLDGVATVFDRSIVYGCGAYATLTSEGNNAHVAVLALGGDVHVDVAVAKTAGKDDDVACGRRIGEALKQAAQTKATGRVLVLFGDCHIPRNHQVVRGVQAVLGNAFPIIGAAAYKSTIFVKGLPVSGSNLGLLLTGDFTCGFSLKKDMTRDGLVSSARDCLKEAVGDRKPDLVLVFDCGGRRGEMLKHKNFDQELAAMKGVVGTAPLFGFYGSGEMGRTCTAPTAKGVGYHIAACAIVAK